MAADEEKLDPKKQAEQVEDLQKEEKKEDVFKNSDGMNETREMWKQINENRNEKIAFKNKVLGNALSGFAKHAEEKDQEFKHDASVHLERDKSLNSVGSIDESQAKKEETKEEEVRVLKNDIQENELNRLNPNVIENKALDSKPLDKIAPEYLKNEESNKTFETGVLESKQFEKSPDKENIVEGEVLKSTDVAGADTEVVHDKIMDKTNKLISEELKNLDIDANKAEDLLGNVENSGETFFDVLSEAGISKQKFYFILSAGLIVIFIILFFIFGGFDLFKSIVPRQDPVVDVVEPPVEIPVEIVPVIDKEAYSYVLSAFEFASEFSPEITNDYIFKYGSDSAITSAYVWGDEYNALRIDLIYYLNLVDQMQTIYSIDVYNLLADTTMRRQVLEEFLNEFKNIILEAETSLAQIDVILANYSAYDSDLNAKINFYEENYFTALDNFKGVEAYENLELFIEFSQDYSEIKAYNSAYTELYSMISSILNLLKPRYDDIVLNKEALIKGIRVFDVPDSDLDVIIPVSRN